MKTADLLLHPVRLRVVQQFLGRGELTTADLRAALADVPTASLYRHLATLLEGGVLTVVDERKVRGAVERTYALDASAAHVGADEAAAMGVEEHRRAFTTFVAGLLGSFDHYLESGREGGRVDLARDLVGYRQTGLHLTDAEAHELLADLRAVLEARAGNEPGPGRRRRLFTTVLLPADPPAPDGA